MSKEVFVSNHGPKQSPKPVEKYVPEYKKRGLDPLLTQSHEEDFVKFKQNQAQKKVETKESEVKKSLLQQVRDKEITREEMETIIKENETQNIPVLSNQIPFSGQNHQTLWQNQETEQDPNNEDFFVENIQDPLSSIVETEHKTAVDNEKVSSEEVESISFKDIEAGQYVLIFKEEVISIGLLSDIEDKIMEIISDVDCVIEDFVILKREKAKMGIFIGD